MNIDETIKNSQEVMAQHTQNIQDAMAKSESGQALLDSSQAMAQSEEMVALMNYIEKEGASEEEKFLMGKYMGQMLQDDPDKGLLNYADYLKGVAEDKNYAARSSYYDNVAKLAIALHESESYRKYVSLYSAFEEDTSDEANEARAAMNQMSEDMRNATEQDAS